MTFRGAYGNGQAETVTEEYMTEARADERAAEVVKQGARYCVVYEVEGRVA